ncbi:flavin reductase family protein [Bacillus fonticola]|uniref:flavin reductase family protein n=1 Tax=Bacillus fonticola TaxID=2728853 RepID=UPI001474DAE6|nr:flavin reductase family protein [Bacillus fonticola]
MKFYANDLQTKDRYKLLSGSVVPRPISWVSTVDRDGEANLAPFSFFNVASREPAMLSLSIGPGVGDRNGTTKDTLENIRNTEQFVVNVVPATLANAMYTTSLNVATDVDEFEEAGLTKEASDKVKAPRVKESPISMECQLEQIIQLGTDYLVIGRVLVFHIAESVYTPDYKINLDALNPLGRLAGTYALGGELFSLPDDTLSERIAKRK